MVFKYGYYNPFIFPFLKYGDFGAFFFPQKKNPLLQVVVPFSFGHQVAKFSHKK
jgi:hypothetical protein